MQADWSRYAVAKRSTKTPPTNNPDRALPVISAYRQHDRLEQFMGLMREHDYGVFARSAPLVDEIMTDDRIYGVSSTRIGAILAAPMKFSPAGEGDLEQKIADEIGGSGDNDRRGIWQQMFSTAAAAEILKWGQHLGLGFGKFAWEKTSDRWQPRLVPWHPSSARWDWMSRRFVVQTESGKQVVLPRPDEMPRGDGQWFVYCPYGVEYGWRSALIRSLAFKYLSRQWTERDHDRLNERQGMGILKGIVPSGNSQPEQREQFFQQLDNVGNEAVVMTPQDTNGKGYDVEVVEFTARTWESFNTRRENLDTDIAIVILGQNLTTEVQGGSRAAAMVHEVLRIDKALQDAQIGVLLREQMLTWYCDYNYGDPDLAPTPIYEVEPPTDDKGEAEALKALGEAGALLKQANPRTDIEAIWEANGIPQLSDEEFAAMEAEKAAKAAEAAKNAPMPPGAGGAGGMAGMGGGGMGGGTGAGGTSGAGTGAGFSVGDRVEVVGKPHMPGQKAGTVKIANGDTYGILFDGTDEVHKWYMGGELRPEGGGAARDDENAKPAKKSQAALSAFDIKKRYMFAGLPIAVENTAGSIRLWTDSDGKQTGSTKMLTDYGFIEGHLSGDGEELDAYVGPNAEAADVYIIHQLKPARLQQRLSNRWGGNPEFTSDVGDRTSRSPHGESPFSVEQQAAWRGGRGQTALSQDLVDRRFVDAIKRSNAADRVASLAHRDRSAQIPETRTAVLSAVVSLLHDNEVRRIVIETVPVDVVNDLLSGKRAAEDTLHDHAVLEALAATVIDQAVLGGSTKRSNVTVSLGHEAEHALSSSGGQWVYDEDKIFLGFASAEDAKSCFLAHRNDGDRAFGGMTILSLDAFKAKLNRRPEGSTRKIRASADTGRAATASALVALAFRGKGGKRTAAGNTRAAKYQDALTKRAIKASARALAPSLEHLFEHVNKAESLAAFRKKLPGLQHGMDLKGLAQVVFQTNVLSKLAGIEEAKKET